MSLQKKTDWNNYYRKPSSIASITRNITQNYLLGYLKQFFDSNSNFHIQEMGGANSCFLEGIVSEFPFCKYSILDNSEIGIMKSNINFKKYKKINIYNVDLIVDKRIINSDVVISAGLIEHFNEKQTSLLIKRHFDSVSEGGIVIITYPTPTFIYRITRKLMEFLSVWQFHDERPLSKTEVENTASKYGIIIDHTINRYIPLSQGILCCKKK